MSLRTVIRRRPESRAIIVWPSASREVGDLGEGHRGAMLAEHRQAADRLGR